MRKFIKKILKYSFPICLFLVIVEIVLRVLPNDFKLKKHYLDKNGSTIENLILGSSHSYYGINPEYMTSDAFNASYISQTLDLDYEIIKKYSSRFNKVSFVIIPIDYFSLFEQLSKTNEVWRIRNYTIYYNLKLNVPLKYYFEVTSMNGELIFKRLKRYFSDKEQLLTTSYLGYGKIGIKRRDLNESGYIAAKRHTINERDLLKRSIEIIEHIIEEAKQNNRTVLFFTSPAYKTYRDHLDTEQLTITLRTMDSISNIHENVHYLNLIDCDEFKAADFADADHLNHQGAKKLTLMIDNHIKAIKNNHQN